MALAVAVLPRRYDAFQHYLAWQLTALVAFPCTVRPHSRADIFTIAELLYRALAALRKCIGTCCGFDMQRESRPSVMFAFALFFNNCTTNRANICKIQQMSR